MLFSSLINARRPVPSYTTAQQFYLNWDFLAEWPTQQNVVCLTSCSCRQPCWSSDTSQCQRCSPHEESDLPQMHQVHHYQNTAAHEADRYSNRQYVYSCDTHTRIHTHTHTCTQTHSLWSSSQTIIVSRVYTPVHHHQRSYFSPTNIPHWKLYTGTYQCRIDWQRCWLSAVLEHWSTIHQSSWMSGQCWLQSKWHDDQTVLLKTKWKCEHNYRSHFKCFLSTHTKRLSLYKCMSTNKKSAKSPFTGNLCTVSKSICTINKTCNSMQCKAAITRLV